ncbi:uncharacterized protein I206_105689 [Kwoniella pini CBS 10737]|uniref:Uncharacterized protein n=1 Tax=Kwoniella pini CBS 10737 TaxID=1296096 RepID=A0A1B9I3R1_9TREE|nr:uncharacterized protein I206_03408 [Kwoniella pini CBS 10737]OCF50091.1 hypothetical protein I206_03408 [Kwoniella pini CBS 10737]
MPAPVMSQLENTSAILGEYMLKGWTLTDLHCDKCRVTPLMREPNAAATRESRDRIQFCALCDGRPETRISNSTRQLPPPTQSSSMIVNNQEYEEKETLNQSDEAALSISDLLLKGYSLLGENCPNSNCKGIPLVGYPKKSNGMKDSRKLCVSCNSRWIDESSIEKEGMTIINQSQESPKSKAKWELYGLDSFGNAQINQSEGKGEKKVLDNEEFDREARDSVKRLQSGNTEKEEDDVNMEEIDKDFDDESKAKAQTSSNMSSHPIRPMPTPRPINNPIPPTSDSQLGQALESTSNSLSSTLQNLSSSLENHTSRPPIQKRGVVEPDSGKWFVDLKLHTEAIKDVLGVLGQVERARRVGY